MPNISIQSNERVFITGKTGSGKTFLARHLTRHVSRLVVLDGKGTLGGSDWNLENWNAETIHKLSAGVPVRIRVVPPMASDLVEHWNDVLEVCLRVGNLVLYIDELYAVVPPNKPASPQVFAVYTRGREFGVGVWASTQRPVWIPLVALSEAEHFFMFRLQLLEDKQRLAAFMGREVLNEIKDIHGFYYSKAIDEEPAYYTQFQPSNIEVENKPPVEVPKMSNGRARKIFSWIGAK